MKGTHSRDFVHCSRNIQCEQKVLKKKLVYRNYIVPQSIYTYHEAVGCRGERGASSTHIRAEQLGRVDPCNTCPCQAENRNIDVDKCNTSVRSIRVGKRKICLLRQRVINGDACNQVSVGIYLTMVKKRQGYKYIPFVIMRTPITIMAMPILYPPKII